MTSRKQRAIVVEKMTLLEFVEDCRLTIDHLGGAWPHKDILLQLGEEAGELNQAFRKKTHKDVLEEAGDVLFVILAFIESYSNLDQVIRQRMEKNAHLRSVG